MLCYKNGQGRVLDEGGDRRNTMDWKEEVGPNYLQTLIHLRIYRKKQGLEQKSTDEGLHDKTEETALKTKQQSKLNKRPGVQTP